jgi:hypothetical protein
MTTLLICVWVYATKLLIPKISPRPVGADVHELWAVASNEQDQCPGEVAGRKVSAKGCAINDADEGVLDETIVVEIRL